MEKKRRFLGFLSFFVVAFTACQSYAATIQCEVGKAYWKGSMISCGVNNYCDSTNIEEINSENKACFKACPSPYTSSDRGATSVNDCYREVRCEPGVCPADVKACVWNVVSLGREYYNNPIDKTCGIQSITCEEKFYITDEMGCAPCREIPGYENMYPEAAGVAMESAPTGPRQCYAVCTPMCTHDECPADATCNYTDVAAGWGGVFYPTEIIPDNCETLIPVSCTMTVTCDKREGYGVFFPGGSDENMRCDPNPITINYDLNGGDGEVEPSLCTYDELCQAAVAPSRDNWEFVGWNTSADGDGTPYAAGADITNIISGGEITLYAKWKRLSADCRAGQYYNGNDYEVCPGGSFCTGEGDTPAGMPGCAETCPVGGTSREGADDQSKCYVTCPAPGEIRNGTLSHVNAEEYNDGVSDEYPVCTYSATCDEGYIAQNNNTTQPKCVWENPDNCPIGFYCPDGADEPILCPRIRDEEDAPRGTSKNGTRDVTGCYYIFEPWVDFNNGNASGECKYVDDEQRYSNCTLDKAFSCLPGYYQLTPQTVGCTGVQQGYYSDGTTSQCLSDNYTDEECVASLGQKPCPERDTNPTVTSAEFATSITQCTKACIKTDAHGTVSVAKERVNADENGVYAACEFAMACDTGYDPVENGSENAHCAARQYTIWLDPDNANDIVINPDGSVLRPNLVLDRVLNSIRCTYDSGVCELPTVDDLTRPGYSVVKKWCTMRDGAGECYDAGTSVATNISADGTDITLYAVWQPNVYKITLNNNGATVGVVPDVVYLKYATGLFEDDAAESPIVENSFTTLPEKKGYVFRGFYNSCGAVGPHSNICIINESGGLGGEFANIFTTTDTQAYACWAPGITHCDAGTYYAGHGAECIECPVNYYCEGGDFRTDRDLAAFWLCPDAGHTVTTGASSVEQCMKDNQVCSVPNGVGVRTCAYNKATGAYDNCDCADGCTACSITSCYAGYSLVGDECIMCPENHVCAGGVQNKCSVLTGGLYEYSDAGSTDISKCWNSCPLADNATEMNGRKYADGRSTCEIVACRSGYILEDGACVACPEGSYCNTDGKKSCADLGDGAWPLSEAGSTRASDCYQLCVEHKVTNGMAIPVAARANYSARCEYIGKSDQGNDCDIVDDVCIETSCRNIYEMKNGRCVLCNREYALSYAAEGNCVIASCMTGYHIEGEKCVPNDRECTASNAVAATQTWDFQQNSYGTCTITECADGYHIASNACVSDVQACDVENGHGVREWNHKTGTWGDCIATSCDAGYTTDASLTNERWKQCGVCNNKFGVLGEVAVSTYVRECEIASCIYQGEKYILDSNECMPICDIYGYEDDTGTMKWNPVTHKCERKCKSGYVMWP